MKPARTHASASRVTGWTSDQVEPLGLTQPIKAELDSVKKIEIRLGPQAQSTQFVLGQGCVWQNISFYQSSLFYSLLFWYLAKQVPLWYQKISKKIMDPFEFICGSLIVFPMISLYIWFVDFYCEMRIWYVIHTCLFFLYKKICIFCFQFKFYWFIY
jgi:hypothetical protein